MRRFDNIAGLLITMILAVAAFFGLLTIIYFILKYFAAGLDSLPFFERCFVFFILSMPSFIFLFAWGVFFRRIKHHSVRSVRGISYCVAAAALLAGLFFYGKDLWDFFRTWKEDVISYTTYGRWFITFNIAGLFITAMLQALTLPKEKDWMDRGN